MFGKSCYYNNRFPRHYFTRFIFKGESIIITAVTKFNIPNGIPLLKKGKNDLNYFRYISQLIRHDHHIFCPSSDFMYKSNDEIV